MSIFLNLQLVDFTSRIRDSNSQTDESRRVLDIGRKVARTFLSNCPDGLRLSSTNWKRVKIMTLKSSFFSFFLSKNRKIKNELILD
jgi:hypothetical protein